MNVKTLVILIGSARGGEETWHSMYKYLLEPLSADLALLFGKSSIIEGLASPINTMISALFNPEYIGSRRGPAGIRRPFPKP